MCSEVGDTTQLVPGFPIRTPWDHSSVDSSPRPIAASHVLHRLLVPRHPPCALSNLTTKMLASTMQHSTNTHPHPPRPNSPTTQAGVLRPGRRCPEQTSPSHHRTPGHDPRLVSSGPNRVPAATNPCPPSLRHHTPTGTATHTQPNTVNDCCQRLQPKNPPDPDPTGRNHRARPSAEPCSLERR
jgi:hypothetical protein